MHDHVDFVTQEAQRAAAAAAEYVKKGQPERGEVLDVKTAGGVTYTVPQQICPADLEGDTKVSFRVNRVFGKSRIVVSSGDKELFTQKKPFMMPGEMQNVMLPADILKAAEDSITVEARED